MAMFITRVELLYADEKDYQKLEAAMKALHFYRSIQDPASGISYYLPDNMYFSSGPDDAAFVLQLAKSAARKTKRTYSVLTIRSDTTSFSGLEPVPAE